MIGALEERAEAGPSPRISHLFPVALLLSLLAHGVGALAKDESFAPGASSDAPSLEIFSLLRPPLPPERSLFEGRFPVAHFGRLSSPPSSNLDFATFDDGDSSYEQEIVAPRFSDYPRALGYSFTKGLFARSQLKPLVVGSVATLAVLPFDDEITDAVQGNSDTLGKVGNVIGSPVTIAALTAAAALVVPFTENQKYEAFAFSLSQAVVVESALVHALKLSISRVRPNAEGNDSFPSGHTSSVMTLATVAQHYYGKKAGIPLFILTGIVGLSRLEQGKHFAADLMFGATLGYLSAKAAIESTEHFASKPRLTIQPSIEAGRTGASFVLSF